MLHRAGGGEDAEIAPGVGQWAEKRLPSLLHVLGDYRACSTGLVKERMPSLLAVDVNEENKL